MPTPSPAPQPSFVEPSIVEPSIVEPSIVEPSLAEHSLVGRSVEVHAGADAVWRVMVDPTFGPRWLGGFCFESSWQVGGPFALVGTLNGHTYREVGSLLTLEPGRRLRYAHWSELWRIPDVPANRAVMTLTLAEDGPITRVSLRHELPAAEALAQHSNFFWRGALEQLRRLVEG